MCWEAWWKWEINLQKKNPGSRLDSDLRPEYYSQMLLLLTHLDIWVEKQKDYYISRKWLSGRKYSEGLGSNRSGILDSFSFSQHNWQYQHHYSWVTYRNSHQASKKTIDKSVNWFTDKASCIKIMYSLHLELNSLRHTTIFPQCQTLWQWHNKMLRFHCQLTSPSWYFCRS